MIETMIESFTDAIIDTAKLIPFLYITYLIMEFIERKAADKSTETLASVGRLGPIFGGIVGVIPQCGFSASAASLYSGGILSIGTLLAVFLSTSDEMLPIFISEHLEAGSIFRILAVKAAIGVISGLGFDFLLRFTKYKYKTEKRIHDLCENEHCHCEDEEEGNLFLAALIHTLHIALFVFLISFALTFAIEGLGKDALAGFLTNRPVIGVLLSALIGLIPNCASSVMITQFYLNGLLNAGQMMAGLLVGAGVGLLVLFRTNRHMRENLRIAGVLYAFGVFWGLLIELSGIAF